MSTSTLLSHGPVDLAKTGYMVNGFNVEDTGKLDSDMQSIVKRRERDLGSAYKLFYQTPVEIVRGEGVYLYDQHGEAYLDVYNNVPSVGHSHPYVVEAVHRQLQTLNTHTRYGSTLILDYSERLLSTFPHEISNIMYTCTGSEANDLALRVAMEHTHAEGIIVTENAYHGNTSLITGISMSMGPKVPVSPNVRWVPAPIDHHDGQDVAQTFAMNIKKAAADLQRHGFGVAALIVDTIFATDGVLTGPEGLLKSAVDAVHEAGGVFIADEVQPGFARTGSHMWGFQRHGVVPDLVTMGKPMGNGLPIAAMAARPEVLHEFGSGQRYFNTFGGNTVCIAAANAVLDVIEKENLMENCVDTGSYMLSQLTTMAGKHAMLGDVRGAGLFLGLDIVKPDGSNEPDSAAALTMVNELRKHHILIGATGKHANILKIRPQLPFQKEHVDIFVNALSDVLDLLE